MFPPCFLTQTPPLHSPFPLFSFAAVSAASKPFPQRWNLVFGQAAGELESAMQCYIKASHRRIHRGDAI
nr:hypothetical protein Iba_chr12cCG18770 [Ipomoea batatas]GMD68985.1 hypothetical protein Iba_chr12dCG14540 [Ipomoea batatas]GMD73008.1 hypothetical protein Iba_chr12fCG14160 [Ipomoea batatas]GME06624.1 hypothetical protein Iba_scaffold4755CG0030 [Ipomoea batatas]